MNENTKDNLSHFYNIAKKDSFSHGAKSVIDNNKHIENIIISGTNSYTKWENCENLINETTHKRPHIAGFRWNIQNL